MDDVDASVPERDDSLPRFTSQTGESSQVGSSNRFLCRIASDESQ